MNDLPEQINQTILARGLFRRGQKILIAVSGGVDSMVLLHVLAQLKKNHNWSITVAHLNHQLRGRSSDADERLVVRTAKSLGVPVVTTRMDVKAIARAGKLSLEMAARKARHEFLAGTAAHYNISHITLAHHADDQVELFFLRLLRGAGSDGLAGMKWRGPSPANARIELVRPLLDQTKDALRAFASGQGIVFREDASNAQLDIQRNRVRRELLPLLRKKYQPALERTILRVMEILRSEAEVVAEAVKDWEADAKIKDCARKEFAKLPVAIQRRSIQSQLSRRGIPADFAWVERLRQSPGKPFAFTPQVSVVCEPDGKLGFHETLSSAAEHDQLKVRLTGKAGQILFAGKKFAWTVSSQRTFEAPKARAGREMFDAGKVGSRIVLRHWRPGDRFQPIGMKMAVKLQDLFVNQKIPRARRHDLVVATTARDEVFWVEGLRISERFKLSSQTTRQLIWSWKTDQNTRLQVLGHHVKLKNSKNVRRK